LGRNSGYGDERLLDECLPLDAAASFIRIDSNRIDTLATRKSLTTFDVQVNGRPV
jgi:hypothetical protein